MPTPFSRRGWLSVILPVMVASACSTEQPSECVEYVECAKAIDLLTLTDTSPVWSQYDADGECWGESVVEAEACKVGCIAATQAARQLFEKVPMQCGGDFVLPPLKSTATVGSSGGTVEVLGLSLDIPAGSLGEEVSITVENTAAFEQIEGVSPLSHLFRFEPEGLSFTSPVTVTFQMRPAQAGETPSAYWTRRGDPGTFEPIGGTVDGATISAEVTHFSRGTVGVPREPTGQDGSPGVDGGVPGGDAGTPPPVDGGGEPTDGGGGVVEDGGVIIHEDGGTLDGGAVVDSGAPTAPYVTSVSPDLIAAGNGDTVITITGGNFELGGVAVIDIDTFLATTWLSSSEATAVIPAAYLATARTTSIGWFNYDPFERADEYTFSVYDGGSGGVGAGPFDGGAADPNGPTVTGISPEEARVGSGDIRLFLDVDSATVSDQIVTYFKIGTSTHIVGENYREPGRLSVSLRSYMLTQPGDGELWVLNWGAGRSASLRFRVVGADVGNPLPTVSNPPTTSNLVRAGSTASERTFVLNGTGFVDGADVLFKYWDIPVTPVESVTRLSESQLQVVLTPRQAAAAGSFSVAVQNPPPGGGASPGFASFVAVGGENPIPVLASVAPNPIPPGIDTTLTLVGNGFLPDFTKVQYDTNAEIGKCHVLDDGNTCVIVMPSSLATSGAQIPLRVTNEWPAGGTSAIVNVVVQ
jgi:hypothetical protein